MTNLFKTEIELSKLGNTAVYNQNGIFIVRFHQTNIVEYESNGNCTLNTGGFPTKTTIRRMNQFLKILDIKGLVYIYKKQVFLRLITNTACFEFLFHEAICKFNKGRGHYV